MTPRPCFARLATAVSIIRFAAELFARFHDADHVMKRSLMTPSGTAA